MFIVKNCVFIAFFLVETNLGSVTILVTEGLDTGVIEHSWVLLVLQPGLHK